MCTGRDDPYGRAAHGASRHQGWLYAVRVCMCCMPGEGLLPVFCGVGVSEWLVLQLAADSLTSGAAWPSLQGRVLYERTCSAYWHVMR